MSSMPSVPPLIIAHRGASADRPEHTLSAYRLAIRQGADIIEPDLVTSRDGHLVARHENEISATTDVADHPEFRDRHRQKTIDGEQFTGWFTEDFTLAELKTLRARERLPLLRPANTAFDGEDRIPTFVEILALVRAEEARHGRRIGIYPETKHPSHFRNLGLALEAPMLTLLQEHGYGAREDPVFIQSFEAGNLEMLRQQTSLRLVQLVAATGSPPDRPKTPFAQMMTAAGLRQLAHHVDGIGVEKSLVIPRGADGRLGTATSLVRNAHGAGLFVHGWTFRPENFFLPVDFHRGNNPAERGDAAGEIRAYLDAGLDGVFSDCVPEAVKAL